MLANHHFIQVGDLIYVESPDGYSYEATVLETHLSFKPLNVKNIRVGPIANVKMKHMSDMADMMAARRKLANFTSQPAQFVGNGIIYSAPDSESRKTAMIERLQNI